MKDRIGTISWILLLISVPFQTRLLIGGWNGEWMSFALYGTDILLLSLLFVTPRWWKEIKAIPGFLFIALFVLIGLVSTFTSNDVLVSVFRISFLFKGLLLAGVASYWFRHKITLSFLGLVIAAFIQSLIGIGQFVAQSDVGLRWLGETVLHPSMTGVASQWSEGVEYLRVYGTTPHPNVLGAVLTVGLLSGLMLLPAIWKSSRKRHLGIVVGSSVILFAHLLTFSRLWLAALFASLILFVGWFVFSKQKRGRFLLRSMGVSLIMMIIFLALLWPWWGERIQVVTEDQSIELRSYYAQESAEVIKSNLILGVGPGNGVTALRDRRHVQESWMNQPVHSIYMLIALETGVVSLVLFLLFIFSVFHRLWHSAGVIERNKRQHLVMLGIILLSFLVVGGFEHLFLTTQQGVLLFWLVVGGIIGLLPRYLQSDVGRLSNDGRHDL